MMSVTHDEAVAVSARVTAETRLSAQVIDEADGDFRVDIDLPLHGDEVRATTSLYGTDDWRWVYPKHVARRLSYPARLRRLFRIFTAGTIR
jgi:hypothetical protein